MITEKIKTTPKEWGQVFRPEQIKESLSNGLGPEPDNIKLKSFRVVEDGAVNYYALHGNISNLMDLFANSNRLVTDMIDVPFQEFYSYDGISGIPSNRFVILYDEVWQMGSYKGDYTYIRSGKQHWILTKDGRVQLHPNQYNDPHSKLMRGEI